jgi:hypothetical protein
MKLFEVSDDTIIYLKKANYHCPVCLTNRKNIKLKLKVTDSFVILSVPYRRCLMFSNPYCSCYRTILVDATQEVTE